MVSEIDGPADQKRLGHMSHLATSPDSKPPDPLSVTVGYQADTATPIAALAEAMSRSAVATSGLRSSSADGTPTGIGGGVLASSASGSENSAGGFPISTPMARSGGPPRATTSAA